MYRAGNSPPDSLFEKTGGDSTSSVTVIRDRADEAPSSDEGSSATTGTTTGSRTITSNDIRVPARLVGAWQALEYITEVTERTRLFPVEADATDATTTDRIVPTTSA